MNDTEARKYEFTLQGTHCSACAVLIERELKQISGVERAKVDYASGKTRIVSRRQPDIHELERRISPHGYHVVDQRAILQSGKNNYVQLGAIILIVLAGYFILRQFNILPSIGVTDGMSYGVVFVIGLVAAISTCMAVTGGLLLAVSAKYNAQHPDLTGAQRFSSHVYFNAGRIISYTVLGGAVGALGSVLTLSSTVNGILTIVVSLIMVILGLQLLNIFPWLNRLLPRTPKFIAHKIYDASAKQGRAAPFLFGALTFFLPCGFTQALQLYVLSKGNFMTGALTMLVFALGTLPALLSVSALASFIKGAWQKYFLTFAGVVVVLIGLLNVNRGFALAGITVISTTGSSRTDTEQRANGAVADNNSEVVNGVQVVKMTINGYDYSPAHFTVKKGVPVEWQIDGSKAAGCAGVITLPKMGITKMLSRSGVTTINFTPTEIGTMNFSCTMGMTTPGAAFTVVESGIDTSGISANINTAAVPRDLSKCDPNTAMCITD